MNYQKVMDELTPVEQHGDMLFKRDDLFIPFKDMPLNGGKVRQALSLVYNNLERIHKEHGGVIATCSSVHSPQGIIVARIAKEFGFKSILGIANPKTDINPICEKHYNLKVARELGCQIEVVAGTGFDQVLQARLKKRYPTAFIISFGMNYVHDKTSIIDCISNQTRNIPKDLDNLIVPMGSSITTCGILNGLVENDIPVKNVWLIQIAGYDRFDKMKSILQDVNYDKFQFFIKSGSEINTTVRGNVHNILSKEFPYTKLVKMKIDNELFLDCIYESKALFHFKNYIKGNGKSLFWIIGNSSCYFDKEHYA